MNSRILIILFVAGLASVTFSPVLATSCIESMSCWPTNPLDVLGAFDTIYGAGTTLVVMALILGVIEMAIYMRTRSMAMLAVMGIYTIAAFGGMMTSPLISSQYHIAMYVIIIAVASVMVMMVLKLVKE